MINKIKQAFLIGQLSIMTLNLLYYILKFYLELDFKYVFGIGLPFSILVLYFFYQIATGSFKKQEKPKQVKPSVKQVKKEMNDIRKNMSKNDLWRICISLQAELNQLKLGGTKAK